MPNQFILSICIPSRNRQIWFKQTIDALRLSPRTDIQLVLADNSDDPSIMNDFMRDLEGDPRIVYLPSTGETLSMIDNWERTAAAATGDYMVFIGDDDYVDPDVAELIKRVLVDNPDIDAFGWRLLGYTWPHPSRGKLAVQVPFDDSVVRVEQSELFGRMFGWIDSRHVPTSGFSVYHNAVSRKLMERIRAIYGNRYFEHPVVDYDSAFKVICHGTRFVATARPFGVMGSCPASNSFGVGKFKDMREKMSIFAAEAKRDFARDPLFREFPFTLEIGTTAAVGIAQHWYKKTYGITYENWGENFARACAMDCENYLDRDSFEAASEGYRTAFSLWEGGRYLPFFRPSFNELAAEKRGGVASGFTDKVVMIDQDIPVSTPAELFNVVRGMVTPVDMLNIPAGGLRLPRETQARGLHLLSA